MTPRSVGNATRGNYLKYRGRCYELSKMTFPTTPLSQAARPAIGEGPLGSCHREGTFV